MLVRYLESRNPDLFELHFSQDLPLFPRLRGPFGSAWSLTRKSSLSQSAQYMARCNHGRFAVEFHDPYEVMFAFLSDLVHVEGLNRVIAARRYLLVADIGRCFKPQDVVTRIAAVVLRHFYPEDLLTVEACATTFEHEVAHRPGTRSVTNTNPLRES